MVGRFGKQTDRCFFICQALKGKEGAKVEDLTGDGDSRKRKYSNSVKCDLLVNIGMNVNVDRQA